MERVQRFCDVDQKKGRVIIKCGQPVPDDEPTVFEIEGKMLSGDFCLPHKKEFLEAVDPFIAVSKVISRPKQVVGGRKIMKTRKGTFTSKDVRKWLEEQGREVSPSGRIAEPLITEYKVAHGL